MISLPAEVSTLECSRSPGKVPDNQDSNSSDEACWSYYTYKTLRVLTWSTPSAISLREITNGVNKVKSKAAKV